MQFMPIGPTSDRDASLTMKPSQEEYDAFYKAFGECFSAWSTVEVNLLSIYIFLLKSSEYDAAAASFYSTIGFRAKLNMVDAIIKNSKSISASDLACWNKLYEKASKKSGNRNQIAHNTVFYGRLSETGIRKMFVANPRTPSEGARLHRNELIHLRDSFVDLSQDLFRFWQSLLPKV
jgi:hypothetical protein